MSDLVEVDDCRVILDTGKALLIEHDGAKFWVPQSLVDDSSEIWQEDDEGTLVIPEWFATKEGIEP